MTVTRCSNVDAALQVLANALENPRLAHVEVQVVPGAFFVRVGVKGPPRARSTSGKVSRGR